MTDDTGSSESQRARLAALDAYGILDTPPESGFDDIVMLAAQICETAVALVSLVSHDRQWFKARIGFHPCETPLDQSVCRHALGQPGLLVIPDLTLDPRTRANTLVTGPPFLRFYAGTPLTTAEGHVLGTLCVIDCVARPAGLRPPQAAALEALGRQVMAQMDWRHAAAARDKALKRMRDGDIRHRQIFDSAIDYAIVSTDLDGRIVSWNAGAEHILGWSEADVLGGPIQIVFTPEDNRTGMAEREMKEARERGRGNDERWHQRKDGSRFWANGEMMPLRADDGQFVGYLKILRDRTEQRRAAEVLQRQSDLLQTITDHVSEAVFLLATDGIVTFVNPVGAEMLGWPAAELIGVNLHDTAHHHTPDGRPFPASACELVNALPLGLPLRKREAVFFRRDGSPIDVVCSNSPVIEDGIVKGAVLTIVDVTEARAATEKLRRSDERLSLAFQASGAIGWWDWDIRRNRIFADESFAQLYSVPPPDAAAGTSIDSFVAGIHPDDRAWVSARIAEVVAAAGEFAAEYRLRQADGSIRWIYARGRCFHDEQGRPLRFPGVSVDITDRKRSEEQQAALVELGDRLRELTDPEAMASVAGAIAGRTMGLTSAAYGTVDLAAGTIDIIRDWTSSGESRLAGRHTVADFGSFLADLIRGELVIVDDVEDDPRTLAGPLAALRIRALLNIPVLEHGRLVEVLCLHDAQPRVWSADKLDFLRSVADRVGAALARQRAENQQDLLNRELSHRMKNLLAMVQAIASQTLRSATSLAGAQDVLGGRLIALSQAHDLLMGGTLGTTQIRAIIESALSVHAERPDRFRIVGPDLEIGARPALALTLMLHELATNAIKYGALSTDDGHVDLSWAITADGAEPTLRLVWREVGGPAVAPPQRRGFGSRFIERGLTGQIGGEVDLDYPATGVVCSVQGPLAAFQSNL